MAAKGCVKKRFGNDEELYGQYEMQEAGAQQKIWGLMKKVSGEISYCEVDNNSAVMYTFDPANMTWTKM